MGWSSVISHHRKGNTWATSRGREQKGENAVGDFRKVHKTTVGGTNHCPGGGNRPVLFNRVPHTSALGIVQEAPLPKHKG